MPPRPMSSSTCNCGKAAARRSREGICAVAVGEDAGSLVMAAWARTHLGQRPCGASAGIAAPHLGQEFGFDIMFIHPLPEMFRNRGYRKNEEKPPAISHPSVSAREFTPCLRRLFM